MKVFVLLRFKHPDKRMGVEGIYATYDDAIIAVHNDNGVNEVIGKVTEPDEERDYFHIRIDTHYPSLIEMQWTGSYYLYEIDITHVINNPQFGGVLSIT